MHFGENELSLGSIGFSPLYPSHPPAFQRRWVRSSTQSYLSFNLDWHRSPSFASTSSDFSPFSDSVSLRLRFLNLATKGNSQDHSPIGTPSLFSQLRPLVSTRFQFLFQSPPGVLFTFPSRYYSLSVKKSIQPYVIWSTLIHTKFLVFRATRVHIIRS